MHRGKRLREERTELRGTAVVVKCERNVLRCLVAQETGLLRTMMVVDRLVEWQHLLVESGSYQQWSPCQRRWRIGASSHGDRHPRHTCSGYPGQHGSSPHYTLLGTQVAASTYSYGCSCTRRGDQRQCIQDQCCAFPEGGLETYDARLFPGRQAWIRRLLSEVQRPVETKWFSFLSSA